MQYAEKTLKNHPKKAPFDFKNVIGCMTALTDCAQTCYICADACLNEQDVEALRRCIRLSYDCGDACWTANRYLGRQTPADWGLFRMALEGCIAACRSCADECDKHAQKHEHCRTTAECCRYSVEVCTKLLTEVKGKV